MDDDDLNYPRALWPIFRRRQGLLQLALKGKYLRLVDENNATAVDVLFQNKAGPVTDLKKCRTEHHVEIPKEVVPTDSLLLTGVFLQEYFKNDVCNIGNAIKHLIVNDENTPEMLDDIFEKFKIWIGGWDGAPPRWDSDHPKNAALTDSIFFVFVLFAPSWWVEFADYDNLKAVYDGMGKRKFRQLLKNRE